MRRSLLLILCCLLLVGCSNTSAPETIATTTAANTMETIPTPAAMEIVIYHGNDNADGFETDTFEVYYFNSTTLIEKLIKVGALTEDVILLSEEYDGTCLHLDFNDAFHDLICSMGTSGEYIVVGSVVNTFLDNYSDLAQSIFITVNGEIFESGHVIYDFELTRYE